MGTPVGREKPVRRALVDNSVGNISHLSAGLELKSISGEPLVAFWSCSMGIVKLEADKAHNS